MRHRLQVTRRRRSQGFSLIELMVATAIGLLLILSALAAYISASSAIRMADAQSRMNEDAQAALVILSQQIRMAGYQQGSRFSIRACDNTFQDIKTAASMDLLTCAESGPHSIALRYKADSYNTLPNSSGIPTDCLGNKLSSIPPQPPGNYFEAENRFFIGTSNVIKSPSLYCKGNGGAGAVQPLVENIENLQLTYGTQSAANETVVGYLTATQVEGLGPTALEAWGKVLTVRICIVVRSEAPNLVSDQASARYRQCDGAVNTTQTDLRLRRAYSATVALRNRLP